jgi:ATP-dependent Clp protease ATP-binding subunit ClpC
MLEFLAGLGVGLVLMIVLIWLAARSSSSSDKNDDVASPKGDGGDRDDLATLYEIAAEISDFFQSSAHPRDLRTQKLFRQGAEILENDSHSLADLRAFVHGDNATLSCLALEAMSRRPDVADAVEPLLAKVNAIMYWPRFFALEVLAAGTPADGSVLGPLLLRIHESWADHPVLPFLEAFAKQRIQDGETPTFGPMPDALSTDHIATIRMAIRRLGGPVKKALGAELTEWEHTHSDTAFLETVGRLWTTDGASPRVLDNEHQADIVARLEGSLDRDPPRSNLLVGESGVGKTSVVRALAERVRDRGWIVFAAGHGDLLAGQSYIGQLEERLRLLVDQLASPHRILWYVPDLHMLAWTGRTSASPVGALDLLLPHIESGRLRIIGETTPGALERLLHSHPRCSTAFEIVRVEPMDFAATRDLAARWSARYAEEGDDGLVPDEVLREAWLLAEQYLGDKAAPGNLLELLELTRRRLAATDGSITRPMALDDLIVTLTRLTGLPAALLDDRRGLELGGLRRHFEAQVLGQPEAVDCLVERVAMIKAGVNDPTRPLGVFLFAGPTGTGKTEIAKALTRFLFGSDSRMIRLDMSEFQTSDTLDRILGGDPHQPPGKALVEMMRRHPFSVVLLDEVEKAHPAVWDAFLQVFDDGRLTDRTGDTVNCRHGLFVLTSNLGAAIRTSPRLGFGGVAPPFSPDEVKKTVTEAFRREFLNRLDRVVVFRPLSRESMRRILRKELEEAFLRRGLRNREWAVVWDDTALEFLLEQGFTPDMGARPLKRAVERHLLTPLAMTIVGHQFPEGDQFLFVRRGRGRLEVEFVDPDAPEEPAAAPEVPIEGIPALQAILLSPQGTPEELEHLESHLRSARALVDAEDFQDRKQAALARTAQPDFWSSSDRFSILGEAEIIDRIEAGLDTATQIFGRAKGKRRRNRLPRKMTESLAQRLLLLETASRSLLAGEPADAFILVEAAPDTAAQTGPNDRCAETVAAMYRAWAARRRMWIRVLSEGTENGTRPYRFLAAVSGFAAYRFLACESGLHVFEEPDEKAPPGRGFRRDKAQVVVIGQPDTPPGEDLEEARRVAEALLDTTDRQSKIVRRYRRDPSPLVRDSGRGWRTGRLDRVLDGDFDLFSG